MINRLLGFEINFQEQLIKSQLSDLDAEHVAENQLEFPTPGTAMEHPSLLF